ncbi:MAG TPA: protein-glutamate O-methyltransferase CheR [Gammaproteobacteria bacterium]|nr:protein-glutamate O-methyltransferase CheR [Gammaproteobacteria bacterium]
MLANGAISSDEYKRFQEFLEQVAGIVLGRNKQYLVDSRLGYIMAEEGIATLGELLSRIQGLGDPKLRERVIDAMTTNETLWFRDSKPYRLLEQLILPKFAGRPLRIWSAACSSGQEPYSISFTVEEFRERNPAAAPSRVEIVATDLSGSMLASAKAAEYDAMSIARGLTTQQKQKFFDQRGQHWVVKPQYRRGVSFRKLNLQDSFSALGRFDVVFCRNVLIYFSAELKRDILNRMADVLHPEGYLILGSSESVNGYSERYHTERHPQGVLFRPSGDAGE